MERFGYPEVFLLATQIAFGEALPRRLAHIDGNGRRVVSLPGQGYGRITTYIVDKMSSTPHRYFAYIF